MASFGQLLASRKEIIIGTKFKILRKIGNGSFGEVYLGIKIADGTHVAIKVESTKARCQTLRLESQVYRKLQGSVGIPRIRWYGCSKEHNVLVIDLLGPSLEDLFNYCSRKFSMKTVLMLADQMIERLQLIHSQGFIHRDLKPENFLMGVGGHCHEVYLIDFGLAKEFHQIPQAEVGTSQSKRKFTGTVRYASINAHRGKQQSWRDDMESLGYLLIYFSRGSLPWQGITANTTQQKYERIKEKKCSMSVEELCKGSPQELAVYLNYCRDLRFEDVPDYLYLRQLFQTLLRKMGFENDFAFDFTILKLHPAENAAAQHSMQDIAQPPLQPPPNEEPNAETAGRSASGNN